MKQTVTAIYTVYNQDGSVKKQETEAMMLDPGDRVVVRDNSYLNKCPLNITPNRSNTMPAGWQGRYSPAPLYGTVVRTNSVQEAIDDGLTLGPRRMQMPIVVLGDDGSVIYCNPVHIAVID